jgi:hypothetical protein
MHDLGTIIAMNNAAQKAADTERMAKQVASRKAFLRSIAKRKLKRVLYNGLPLSQ